MEDSKLFEVLRKLSNKEFYLFNDYIQSPFFNKNQILIILYEYLKKLAPDFKNEMYIEKEYIFKYLFNDKTYDELFLNSLFSRLLTLLYHFLAQEQYQKHTNLQELYILRAIRTRKLTNKHNKIYLKKYAQNANQYVNFTDYSWANFLLYKELDLQFLGEGGRTYNENLQLKNDNLDLLYFSEKLKTACDMLSRNIVVKVKYMATLLDEIKILLSDNKNQHLSQQPVIAIYFGILTILENPDQDENYQLLCSVLYSNFHQFAKEELMDMFGYLLNYCIRKVNNGNTIFYNDIWKHYIFIVEQKIVYINNCLPAWEYKNIITTALRLQKYTEAQAFAERYKLDLPEEVRDNAYNYNLAAIFYSQKFYKKALLMLHNVEFSDATYHLGAKIIQIKSYYELNENDALYSLIDAFSIYLRRNQHISDYIKQANQHFLRIAKKLFQLKSEKQLFDKATIKEMLKTIHLDIDKSSPLANKDWLLTVYNQLINNK